MQFLLYPTFSIYHIFRVKIPYGYKFIEITLKILNDEDSTLVKSYSCILPEDYSDSGHLATL